MILTPITIIMAVLFVVFLVVMIVLVRKKKTGMAVLLLAGAVAAGIYGYKEYNRGNKDLAKTKADISMPATALISEYMANDTAADKKYLGKIIETDGNVKEIQKDEAG